MFRQHIDCEVSFFVVLYRLIPADGFELFRADERARKARAGLLDFIRLALAVVPAPKVRILVLRNNRHPERWQSPGNGMA